MLNSDDEDEAVSKCAPDVDFEEGDDMRHHLNISSATRSVGGKKSSSKRTSKI